MCIQEKYICFLCTLCTLKSNKNDTSQIMFSDNLHLSSLLTISVQLEEKYSSMKIRAHFVPFIEGEALVPNGLLPLHKFSKKI